MAFMQQYAPATAMKDVHVLQLSVPKSKTSSGTLPISAAISAVLFHPEAFSYAKQYWQHSGDGISSRHAEFCQSLFNEGLLIPDEVPKSPRQKQSWGPRRYQRTTSIDETATNGSARTNGAAEKDNEESSRFLEERFGRNLDVSLVKRATIAIKRRIAGAFDVEMDAQLSSLPEFEPNSRGVKDMGLGDVYLFPCGMNAIFNTHRLLLAARGSLRSIDFGFPYVDTLKILQKFGPGCQFYGRASEDELDELERHLEKGERFLALFCEFPGNPLLTCPNLVRIRQLADKYDFAVVIDETIGTFANINVMPFADVVVSSLTKIFSGASNVMGGSAVLNPAGKYYDAMKKAAATVIEDTYWAEDVIFLERNSRDYASRVDRVNTNAEIMCETLLAHPLVREVNYPKYGEAKANYDICKLPKGGYGGLLSVVFHKRAHAVAFYDALETAKGPSLGTNFTLTSPYVVLAHYGELDWAKGLGVDPDLIRISIGLEETEELTGIFKKALKAAEEVKEA